MALNKEEAKLKLKEKIKAEYPRARRLLQELVRFPSVSGQEGEAQRYLAEQFRRWGCEVDLWEPRREDLEKYPGFLTRRDSFEGSPNVVGTLKGGGTGRSLILNGHIDVVPSGETPWKTDPWSGAFEDGRILGRGTADMKGGSVAVFFAAAMLKEAGLTPGGDIILQSVIEEEAGGAGTLACVDRGYRADGALIPEPTDEKIYPASMGSMWFRITVPGLAAHGSTAYLGVNAVEKAQLVVTALKELETVRNRPPLNPLYRHMPVPFCINIGRLCGGSWPSSVPDEAVMEGRIGFGPGETVEEVRRQLAECLKEAAARDPWLKDHPPQLEWYGSCWHSGGIGPDHPLAETLKKVYREGYGREPAVEGAPWATDAAALIRFGQTPALVYGPGEGRLAHQTDESIALDRMLQVSLTTADFIVEWCGVD